MASLVSRVVAFRRTEHFRRLWKYASVSIVSTIVSQVVLFSTYHIWKVGSAMECNVIATAVASVPAYYLNRTWTWGKTGRSKVWREVVPFWTISFTAMVISTAAVGVAAHNADRIASGSLARASDSQRRQPAHLRLHLDRPLLHLQPLPLRRPDPASCRRARRAGSGGRGGGQR